MSKENAPDTAPEAKPAEPAAAPEKEAAAAPATETARLGELEAEVARLKDQLLRAVAETENVRRRLEQQAEDRGKYAVTRFAEDILPVADNLRRAVESLPAAAVQEDALAAKLAEGIELTQRAFITALERHQVRRIEAMGQKFDPHLHQAMMEVDDPSRPPGTVVHEMQAGYTIHGRLLRAAMVGVSKGGPREPVDTTA